MKLTLLTSLVTLTIFFGFTETAKAETIQVPCGSNIFYSINLPSGVAESGSKCTGDLIIDTRVKIIGKNAFSFSKITSVKLSNSVKVIESSAFSYTTLTALDLGGAIESIGFEAFRMSRFPEVVLPNTLKVIGESAFADTYFRNIKLPNSLVSIGTTAFAREDSRAILESITIPDSVKELGYAAFVRAGLKSVTLGTGLTEISASAFEGNKLENLQVPSSVKLILSRAFRSNPLSNVELNAGLQVIDSEAFANTAFESLIIPNSVTQIGSMAFANNKSLKTLDFSDSFEGNPSVDNNITVGDIFSGDYGIEKIIYCGPATGFYVVPTCEGARKVNFAQKMQAELEQRKKEQDERDQIELNFQKQQAESLALSIRSAEVSSVPITIKVTSANPLCPKGFNLLPQARPMKGAHGLTILCESIVLSEAERQAAMARQAAEASKEVRDKSQIPTPTNSPTAQVTMNPEVSNNLSERASVAKAQTKTSITCLKGKVRKIVTGVNPRCPVGYKKSNIPLNKILKK